MTKLKYCTLVDRTVGNKEALSIRFVGTASFVVENSERSIVVDPFVSRPSIWKLAFPLRSNEKLVDEKFPRADDILIGHSHHDHLMDAPCLCSLRAGSRIIGGRSSSLIASALGVPDDAIVEVEGDESIACGSASVRPIPSRHAPVLGNWIPFNSLVTKKPTPPLYVWDFKRGEVFDWQIQISGKRIVHIGSADFIEEEIEKISINPVDVVCLCAANWRHRNEAYIRMVIDRLQPKFVIPCHWDNIFEPWGIGDSRPSNFSRAYLAQLIDRINSENKTEVILLDFDGILKL